MERILSQISELVRRCGEILLDADRAGMGIDREYDTKVQAMLYEGLQKILPGAQFMGEEGAAHVSAARGLCFVVDPIDGTTNFIKDYHMSCISVALLEDGVVQLGVIYNPYLKELYHAVRGGGAFCNGSPIRVSEQPLENGIVLFGTSPYDEALAAESFRMAYEYFRKSLDIRRSGSAALDLCAIAAGRAELFFEMKLSPWDYAAGSLLVEEAGGKVTDLDGNPLSFAHPCSLLAKNR